MTFTFKPARRAAVETAGGLEVQAPPEEEIGLIDGRTPDSIEEWRVYLALKKLKLPFMYQYAIAGGRQQRGGVVIDFVYWNPFLRPILVHGRYWHKGDERLEVAIIAHYLKLSPDEVEAGIIWDDEIPTQADADRVVRRVTR